MTSGGFCSLCCREEQEATEHLANKEYSEAVKLIWRWSVTDTLLKVLPSRPHEVKLSQFLQETSDLMKESHPGEGRPLARTSRPVFTVSFFIKVCFNLGIPLSF